MLQVLVNLLIVFGLINVFSWVSLALIIYCFEVKNKKKLFCGENDNVCIMLIIVILPSVVLVVLVYNFYLNDDIQNEPVSSVKIRGENPMTLNKAEEDDNLKSVDKKRSIFGSRFFGFENFTEQNQPDSRKEEDKTSEEQDGDLE